MKFLLTFLFFVVTNIFLSQTYKPNWITNDFNKAYNQGLKESKPVLIYFTSGGWSPYCKDLDNLIINTKKFKEWSDTNFILLKLIYPSELSKTPSEIDLENEKIRKSFANIGWPIYGYPKLLLVQPMICEEIHVYMEFGLISGLENPKNWISRFEEMWYTGK